MNIACPINCDVNGPISIPLPCVLKIFKIVMMLVVVIPMIAVDPIPAPTLSDTILHLMILCHL